MAERLYCRKGHRWEPTFAPNVWPPDFRTACPLCGDAPLSPFDVTATTVAVMVVLALVFLTAGVGLILVSEDALPFGIILLVLAGLMPLIGLGIWAGRQKMKKRAAVAEQMGFVFLPNLTVSSLRAVAPFRLFAQGYGQKAYYAMQGRVGDCDLLYFQYQYTIGNGKSSQTFTHSAVILFDGADGMPDFLLTPRTIFDKLLGLFTHGGVELEDAAEFAKRYKLTGPDEAALRKTFHPELVQYLGTSGRWFVQAANGQLLLYKTPAVGGDRVPGFVTDTLEIRDMLRGVRRPTA